MDHAADAGAPGLFDTIAIVGLGLMGGSLGLALREGGIGRAITGYDALPGRAERARALGAITAAAESPAAAVAGADLVVLAAPVLALRELLRAIAPRRAPSSPTWAAPRRWSSVGHAKHCRTRRASSLGIRWPARSGPASKRLM